MTSWVLRTALRRARCISDSNAADWLTKHHRNAGSVGTSQDTRPPPCSLSLIGWQLPRNWVMHIRELARAAGAILYPNRGLRTAFYDRFPTVPLPPCTVRRCPITTFTNYHHV